jgi:hypothetical protein
MENPEYCRTHGASDVIPGRGEAGPRRRLQAMEPSVVESGMLVMCPTSLRVVRLVVLSMSRSHGIGTRTLTRAFYSSHETTAPVSDTVCHPQMRLKQFCPFRRCLGQWRHDSSQWDASGCHDSAKAVASRTHATKRHSTKVAVLERSGTLVVGSRVEALGPTRNSDVQAKRRRVVVHSALTKPKQEWPPHLLIIACSTRGSSPQPSLLSYRSFACHMVSVGIVMERSGLRLAGSAQRRSRGSAWRKVRAEQNHV